MDVYYDGLGELCCILEYIHMFSQSGPDMALVGATKKQYRKMVRILVSKTLKVVSV